MLYCEGCSSSRWWVWFIPLGRHARVTIPVDRLDPTYFLPSSISVGGTFLAHETLTYKTSHETSLDLDSCFDLHKVSSASLRQPHQWMDAIGIWAQYLRSQAFWLPTWVTGSWSHVCTIGLSWKVGKFSMEVSIDGCFDLVIWSNDRLNETSNIKWSRQ